MVGARGFEPPTPCAQGRCATRLRYAPTKRKASRFLILTDFPVPSRSGCLGVYRGSSLLLKSCFFKLGIGGVSVSRIDCGPLSKEGFLRLLPKLLQKPEMGRNRAAPDSRHSHLSKPHMGGLSFLFPIPALNQPIISQLRIF